MELLELSHYPGLFSELLGFLGRGHELCLALASKKALTIIVHTFDRENALLGAGTM
jgi:hypothetical protein